MLKQLMRWRGAGVFLVLLITLTFAGSAEAANHFVRPNGSSYGSGDGSSWSNAYSGFSSISWGSIACGDTIWVAGGTYTQKLAPAKSCTSASRLSIRRARSDASECTSSQGWSASFDSTVEQYRTGITFNSYNYITVSGRTSAGGGAYGWLINFPGVTSGIGIDWPNGSNGSFITVEYMEVHGPDILGFTGDGRGIDDTPGSSATDHTFSHMKIIGWESGIYIAGTNNHVAEYIDMSHIRSDGRLHPNLYYIIGSSGGIIRNSRFHDSAASGTGIAFSDGGPWNNWTLNGNVFYNMSSASGTAINVQEAAIVGLKLYNNTFYNNAMNFYLSGSSCGSGSESRNNLVYGSGGSVSCGTSSNNITASSNPFVNSGAEDFHIISAIGSSLPRDKGMALPSLYSIDPGGVNRGADGTWDVGAYEYSTSGPCTSCAGPAAPTNVRVIK